MTPRADKAATPPKSTSDGTTYEVSIAVTHPEHTTCWLPVGEIKTKGGAPTARRLWANAAGDKYNGELLRAVPVSNINEGAFDVAIERKLTPKATQ